MSNTELAIIISVVTVLAIGGLMTLIAYVGFEGACNDHEEEQDMEGKDNE